MKNYKIFIACDTTNQKKVRHIIANTKNSKIQIGYKFGLEFINSKNGRNFLSQLKKKIVFLDLKLNDIPNTCLSTIKAIKDLKPNYITIHISAGFEALKAVKKVSGKIKVAGVTTLTSLNDKSLKEIGYDKTVNTLILHQSKLAIKAKLDALVCSAREVKFVKKIFKKEIITPGIRFNKKKNDQKRVMTPVEAFRFGSDWIVIGRPVTKGNIKNNMKKLINHLEND
tara:strand:- start:4910 stop:5587 length:678 start_codon:yes stop_codon:yes gene_type:complete